MAGHSKWDNIKHKKAAADKKRGKAFTKHARIIEVAARSGADAETNAALRLAIASAKKDGVPADNIDRAVRKGAGLDKGAVALEEIVYEGRAPGGVPILVSAATDNRNRTNSDVRAIFSKYGGQMGEVGSVAWQFTRAGMIVLEPRDDADEQDLRIIDSGAEDLVRHGEAVVVWTAAVDFAAVLGKLDAAGEIVIESELTYRPTSPMELDPEASEKLASFVERFEDLDDVVSVVTAEA